MKKLLYICFFLFFLTGCSIDLSPSALIKPPNTELQLTEINQIVYQFLPDGAHLVFPNRPRYTSSILRADLDGDHRDEIITFYENKNHSKLTTLILKEKLTGWYKIGEIEEVGTKLDYVGIKDLTGDQQPELIIGHGANEETNDSQELVIYSFQDRKFKKIFHQSYTEFAIGNLDNHPRNEMILLSLNKEKQQASAQLIELPDGQVKKAPPIPLDGTINEYTHVIIGNLAKNQKALFIDVGVGSHSSYTEVLILKHGQLVRLFPAKPNQWGEKTYRAAYAECTDINGDGVIEIPKLNVPVGYNDKAMTNIPWITSWYQWTQKKNQLQLVDQSYHYMQAGYLFHFPKSWINKITITRDENDDSGQSIFYYLAPDGQQIPILTIHHVPREDWPTEKNKQAEEKHHVLFLKEEENRVFYATLPEIDSQLSKELQRNEKVIKQHFRTFNF